MLSAPPRVPAADAALAAARAVPADLEHLAESVAFLLGAPTAFVSIVGTDRTRFVAAAGLPAELTGVARDASLCRVVVDRDAAVVVDDAHADPLTAGSALVAEHGVGAYLGVPLRDGDGRAVGAVCALDHAPRTWTARQRTTLELLAERAADALRAGAALPAVALDAAAGPDAPADLPVSLAEAVAAARQLLGMDVAYLTQHDDEAQNFVLLDGDAASFGVGPGARVPHADTYCVRLQDGRLPNPLRDAGRSEEARSMPITEAAGVGAFASAEVVLADGTRFGTLCVASHRARPDLRGRDVQFLRVLARVAAAELDRAADERRAARTQAVDAGLTALAAAVDARDAYTGAHARTVVELAGRVADALALDAQQRVEVEQVALLHDIGKLAIPDAVLLKPGPLDPEEEAVMREHPAAGARILEATSELRHLAPAIRAEHERWDGAGYPDGLAGEAIPVASRIVLVCDAFHAMTSDRPYRRAMPEAEALAEVARCAGRQFCPRSAAALLAALEGDRQPAVTT